MTTGYQESLARSAVYEFLSLAFLYPDEGAAARLTHDARQLEQAASEMGMPELGDALAVLAGRLGAVDQRALEQEYVEVFGHTISNDCAPYEGEYGQAHVFQKSGVLADLNSFYAAFGVGPNPELKDRPDHLSVEMEFMHLLSAKEAYAHLHHHGEDKVRLCREAQRAFLKNHLAHWVKSFAKRLESKAGDGGVYGPLAQLLNFQMGRELRTLGVADAPPQDTTVMEPDEGDQECGALSLPMETAITVQEGN